VEYDASIVGHARAETVVGIDADHRGMCKFKNDKNSGYRMVLGAIQDYVMEIVKKLNAAQGSYDLVGLVLRRLPSFFPIYILAYVNDIIRLQDLY